MPMALTGIGEGGPPPYSPEVLRETKEALRPLAPYMTADNVAPLVVYLASRRCTETHRIFSVGAGHVARVFVAATRGWYAPDLGSSTPEEVEANLDAACDSRRVRGARVVQRRVPVHRRAPARRDPPPEPRLNGGYGR